MNTAASKLLTIDDLAERWSVSVDMAVSMTVRRGVPFLSVGARKNAGPKSMRFRLDAVESWERGQQVIAESPDVPAATAAIGKLSRATEDEMLRAAGWDGVRR